MSDDGVYGPYHHDSHLGEVVSAGRRTVSAPPADSGMSSGPEQPRLRMRDRLARFTAVKAPQLVVLDPLFTVLKANHPKADLGLIERAYRTAEHYHTGQKRKSGDPYITHPLAVATILAELGMTEPTVCAGLLHDTVEDTSYTLDQLRADFGDTVAELVDGVTKLDKVQYGESASAETIRKMVIAMSRDIRVLVVKLADRLHNMRTLGFLRSDKQHRIARQTLEIYAPLAHRLGMNAIKWELEDLCFSILEPKIYDEIVRLVAQAAPQREQQLREVIDQVQEYLTDSNIIATVYGRPKHYYSIYQKMVVRGRDFADIYDLVGLRILVDSTRDCYGSLGVIHTHWNPLPGRFKDYIAMPKYNMYQSLHTTVLGPGNRPVEFQIRTHEMHRRAEFGVAAHWKYKEDPNVTDGKIDPEGTDLAWVHQLNQWTKEQDDPEEFLDSLRFEIQSTEVYVFTPKGDVLSLPQGATPIDLAYTIHTEVGHRCIGARVNGKLASLESQLSNGDIVEILTSKAENAGPSRDWLNFVVSPRAKSKIRHYFTQEHRDEAISIGKDDLAKHLRKTGMPMQRLLTMEHLVEVADSFQLASVDALYAAIGEGNLGAPGVVQRLIASEGDVDRTLSETFEEAPVLASTRASRRRSKNDAGVIVEGDSDMWVKLAKCCTPMPGDEILGFITRENGVSVHRRNCTNAANLLTHPERIVEVSWAPSTTSGYLVSVQIEALDRPGILADITRALADQQVSISAASVSVTKDHLAKCKMTFESSDPTHLHHVLATIRKVPSVYDVYRVKQ